MFVPPGHLSPFAPVRSRLLLGDVCSTGDSIMFDQTNGPYPSDRLGRPSSGDTGSPEAPSARGGADRARIARAHKTLRRALLAHVSPEGCWVGRLSSSALSSATAVSALVQYHQRTATPMPVTLLDRAVAWMFDQQNEDGGWGDTPSSFSNIATTMLVTAAIRLWKDSHGELSENRQGRLDRARAYMRQAGGVAGLRRRYGTDRTFAVPILMNAALAGEVDWSEVSPLPFEFAVLPQSWYRFAQLPVVSYAIPALVAVGQVIHHHRPSGNPIARSLRNWAIRPSLRVLERIQPTSGGFLEAIPLTSFVVMSLAASGQQRHRVVERGVEFLRQTVRADGSWPIDSNLATWVTTLAVQALLPSLPPGDECDDDDGDDHEWRCDACLQWLLNCQHQTIHPYTGAAAGGWGWTDLSGAVPDADDTPGALLAIGKLWKADGDQAVSAKCDHAIRSGVDWLMRLQNRDGGWPTFCRGWGTLPFDRSGSDLTAHALRALYRWQSHAADRSRWHSVTERGWRYLADQQRPDGSWTPLWFGNQSHPQEENPVYGTARVILAYRDAQRLETPPPQRGLEFLMNCQSPSGGWGSIHPSNGGLVSSGIDSVEETALAVETLLTVDGGRRVEESAEMGLEWLIQSIDEGGHLRGSPIGLYFAKLWYSEKLYPLTFATAALRAAAHHRAT